MKNDIEWLKEEVQQIQNDGLYFRDNYSKYDQFVNVEDLIPLIDQLDEPETLSEEWINEHSKSYTMENSVEISDLKNLLLPQPKKSVIPQFVADWINAHNLHGNNPLIEYRDLENDFNEGWTNEKDAEVYHWVNKNPYAFIDSLRYGYEVEKEKLYYVVNKENYFMLRKYDGSVDVMQVSSTMSRDEYGKYTSFMLTEKEIKDYDKRYWAFAEEVTE